MDPFATLGLPHTFALDLRAAEKAHRELSRALHPDRFGSSADRKAALARAMEVNEAWRIVRDPVRRAEAMFRLKGIEVGEDKEPKPAPEFLMDILEQREALSEARAARDRAAVLSLRQAIEARRAACEHALSSGLDGRDQTERTAEQAQKLLPKLGELRFYRRFLDEVSAMEDEWNDGTA